MNIEVVYATPEDQPVVQLVLEEGATVLDAVRRSALCEKYADIEIGVTPVGIYGERARYSTELADGDRVEIYRPLLIDPMQARRLRAQSQAGKTQAGKPQAGKSQAGKFQTPESQAGPNKSNHNL